MTDLEFEMEDVPEEGFKESLAKLAKNYLYPNMGSEVDQGRSDRLDVVYAEIYRKISSNGTRDIYESFPDHALTNGNGVTLVKSKKEYAAEIYNRAYEKMD